MNGPLGKKIGVTKPENLAEINPQLIVDNLNFIQKMTLKITHTLLIDKVKREGWSEELPLYLFKCDHHGYELNYPQSHFMNLICPDCLKQQEDTPNPPKI